MSRNRKLSTSLSTQLGAKIAGSSIHGLSNIFRRESRAAQLGWTGFTLAFSTICTFSVINSLVDYLEFNVTTKIMLIDENNVTFPAVEICNTNPYLTDYSIEFLTSFIESKTNHVYKNNISKVQFINQILFEDKNLINLLKNNINLKTLNRSELGKFGIPLTAILIGCQFVNNKCSIEDFEWRYREHYGNCFTFNSFQQFRVIGAGYNYRLQLELFAGFEGMFPAIHNNHGLRINIYNQSEISKIHASGISIMPGTEINIQIKRLLSNKLKEPYSSCFIDNNASDLKNILHPKVFKFISSLNKTYTQSDCMQFCYEHLVSKKCKCSNVPQENHMKACILNDEIDCLNRLYKRVMINKEENECLILCPLECSHASFRFSSSFSKYPTLAYSSFLLNNHSYFREMQSLKPVNIQKSILKLNIYYRTLEYELIAEVAKSTWLDLISSIGGQIGLFIGGSLLSIFEVIEILFEIFIHIFKVKCL